MDKHHEFGMMEMKHPFVTTGNINKVIEKMRVSNLTKRQMGIIQGVMKRVHDHYKHRDTSVSLDEVTERLITVSAHIAFREVMEDKFATSLTMQETRDEYKKQREAEKSRSRFTFTSAINNKRFASKNDNSLALF